MNRKENRRSKSLGEGKVNSEVRAKFLRSYLTGIFALQSSLPLHSTLSRTARHLNAVAHRRHLKQQATSRGCLCRISRNQRSSDPLVSGSDATQSVHSSRHKPRQHHRSSPGRTCDKHRKYQWLGRDLVASVIQNPEQMQSLQPAVGYVPEHYQAAVEGINSWLGLAHGANYSYQINAGPFGR